jgi:hypothetical protein
MKLLSKQFDPLTVENSGTLCKGFATENPRKVLLWHACTTQPLPPRGIGVLCCREDVCALKRLQRDAFEQLLRLSERLDEVERESDSSGVGSTAGTTLLASAGGRKRTAAGTSGRSQVHVSGQVVYGREYLSLEVRASAASLYEKVVQTA